MRAVEKGIYTEDGRYGEVGVIICTTGYDVGESTLPKIIGKNGVNMREKFGVKKLPNGEFDPFMPEPKTVFGNHMQGFPNFFLMNLSQSTNPVTNVTYAQEKHAEYIVGVIQQMKKEGTRLVDTMQEADDAWNQHVRDMADGSIWTSGCSGRGNWYTRNGQANTGLYFGSHTGMRKEVDARKDSYLVFQ